MTWEAISIVRLGLYAAGPPLFYDAIKAAPRDAA
ncbi:hypothetical protein SAMN05428984_1680 [Sphingomonas sp. OK281]|nr:hypothetical protein SAMN05428984_1680 [Sphingomonas sp. OK281]